jgi:uncharacterized protein involved in oxidation of intracellular sulfur
MKLAIIINTNDHETAWNALRLGAAAIDAGHKVKVFLLGNGVEIESIRDEKFNVGDLLGRLATTKTSLLGCGTCMRLRRREAGTVVKSSLTDLVKIVEESDKTVTFG